jgi:hypothetical protein
MPVAVVAVKEAGMFKLAFGPNKMPAGFMMKRLEVPFVPPITWMRPLITEGSPPVTRVRIFWMAGLERKLAVWFASRPNLDKL